MSSRTKRILKLCEVSKEQEIPKNENKTIELTKNNGKGSDKIEVSTPNEADGDLDSEPEPFEGSSSDEYVPPSDSEVVTTNDETEDGPVKTRVHTEKSKDVIGMKRKKDASKWKKNIRKQKRMKGEEYLGFRNVVHSARPMLPSPCSNKPTHSCISAVDENQRHNIYENYRSLPSVDDQRQFVLNHVGRTLKKRTTRNIENSRRNYTYHYIFTVKDEKKCVCREFFMATLNITDAFIRTCLKKTSDAGVLIKEQRGKHSPHNKLDKEDEDFLRHHIISFPAVESHYCRQSSSKKYLDSSLNISIMHRMYTQKCLEENRRAVSLEKYRALFNEYNLGFFKPKKDQCKKCLFYNRMAEDETLTEDEKEIHKNDYDTHIDRKTAAREKRDEDKEIAENNSKVLSFNFDLQAVLNTPKGSTGQIFYLRKLDVYNLTIYNLGNQDVVCYLWDETQGKRGANEISSCIYDYILAQKGITEVPMMSDGCGGQQKNSIFAAMCLDLVTRHPTLQTIDHRFFETGHTEMECDSIHSKIEKKSKHVPVYTPEGWAQVIRSSRVKPTPFVVKNMMFDDFYDFKLHFKDVLSQIPWRSVCWIQYRKHAPSTIFYKKNFKEDEFVTNEIKRKNGRPKSANLEKAFNSEFPIAEAKYQNLLSMCNDLTIPKVYHNFYRSLKTNKTVRDSLPEPDADEDSDYE